MAPQQTQDLHAQEAELLASIRAENPERLLRPAAPDPDLILGRIGVTYLPSTRPDGYLRLYPHDFIVEEIGLDGSISSITEQIPFEVAEDKRTLWIDLVKAGIAGPHAVTDLAHGLGIDPTQIGYGGIKDAIAITSQRMSLRGVTREAVEAFQHDRLWIRPVKEGSGALQPGDLQGNRFTIIVRGNSEQSIQSQVDVLARRGFYNIFGPQRFGPRLISHRLGQAILRNEIDKALKLFFSEPGPFDVPLFADVRRVLGDSYGDWKGMLEVAQNFPYTLRAEIRVLEALVADPQKTRAALALIKDQVKLWVYAYASWLMNRRISAAVEAGQELPSTLSLPLSPGGALPEYAEQMKQDGTLDYRNTLAMYPYLQTSIKTIPTLMVPQDIRYEAIPQGWVIRFSLGKGAYATSCLSHMFRLYEGLPLPPNVPTEDVDAFELLGDGNLDEIRSRFGEILKRRDQSAQDEADAE